MYITSAIKLLLNRIIVATITHPFIREILPEIIEVKNVSPNPGYSNIYSINIDPNKILATPPMIRLLVGIKALRSACLLMTSFSGTPLARAVLM